MEKKCRFGGLVGLILAFGIILAVSSFAFAEDETPTVVELSLDQAIQLGLSNNDKLNLAQLSVDANKVGLEQAKYKADKLQNTIDKSPAHIAINQDFYLVLNILPAKAQLGYDLAQVTAAYAANNVKYGIETAYYSLQVADAALHAAQLSMERNETLLKDVQLKMKQGVASKIDLYSAQAGYSSSQASYAAAKQKADYVAMLLCQSLGLEVTSQLLLTDRLSLADIDTVNVDEAIDQALTADLTYYTVKNSYDLALLMGDYTQRFSSENTFDYRQAGITKKQAETAYANAKSDLEIRVRYAHNELETALSNYNSLTTSKQAASEAYRLAKLSYEAGMATLYDVQNAEATLQQADTGLLNAEKDYNLAVAAFRYGIYPTPDIDE